MQRTLDQAGATMNGPLQGAIDVVTSPFQGVANALNNTLLAFITGVAVGSLLPQLITL